MDAPRKGVIQLRSLDYQIRKVLCAEDLFTDAKDNFLLAFGTPNIAIFTALLDMPTTRVCQRDPAVQMSHPTTGESHLRIVFAMRHRVEPQVFVVIHIH